MSCHVMMRVFFPTARTQRPAIVRYSRVPCVAALRGFAFPCLRLARIGWGQKTGVVISLLAEWLACARS